MDVVNTVTVDAVVGDSYAFYSRYVDRYTAVVEEVEEVVGMLPLSLYSVGKMPKASRDVVLVVVCIDHSLEQLSLE